jgi:hypothetical protein
VRRDGDGAGREQGVVRRSGDGAGREQGVVRRSGDGAGREGRRSFRRLPIAFSYLVYTYFFIYFFGTFSLKPLL